MDYAHVKPPNGDGFVNWLTTHLANALGAAAVTRTRARIVAYEGFDLCRLDVAKSSRPIWAKTSKERPRLLRAYEQLEPRDPRGRARPLHRGPLAGQ